MKNQVRTIIIISFLIFFIQLAMFGYSFADDWTQTSQSDFEDGTKVKVDVISDPGNVTLSQKWIKAPTAPTLDLGPPASWEDNLVWAPRVIYDGTIYHMWYSGDDSNNGRIGYANSTDGITWTKYLGNPVLDCEPTPSWEESVYVPAVVYDGAVYHMWYTGYDLVSTYRIGYANSSDGLSWIKYPGNPVLDVGSPGSWDDDQVHAVSVLFNGTMYQMWYSGYDGSTQRIGYANSTDGITWTKNVTNPVVDVGLPGSWDDAHAYYPTTVYNETTSTYHMWYIGSDGTTRRIGYATSQNGINWTKYSGNPVLDVGLAGTWDDRDLTIPNVIYHNSTYHLFYTGVDGTNFRIGYANSSDGIYWTKIPSNYVLDTGPPGSWEEIYVWAPCVIYNGINYQMWYTGDDIATYGRIGYATSLDGIAWSKYGGNPVLDLGLSGSWEDTNIDRVSVLFIGTTYHMWYSGDNGTNVRIGYATSLDGITWVKHPSNPVLDLGMPGSWDDTHVWAPTVLYDGLTYHMWYTGCGDIPKRIGYATSLDGIIWTKNPGNPVLDLGSPGSWDDTHVRVPTVNYDGRIYHMWYSGCDGPNNMIGYATSMDGIIWIKDPANPVLNLGPPGSWDDVWVRDPYVLYDGETYRMWYTGYDGSERRIGYAIMGYQPSGTFISSIFDSGYNGTIWNYVNWTETLPLDTNITMAVRSGNTSIPDMTWSPWSQEMWNGTLSSLSLPRTRYIQYRATLTTRKYNLTPILNDVNINYTLNTAQPPVLTSPSNDILTRDNTPTFQWSFSDLEGDTQKGFTVQIDDDPSFSSVDYISGDIESSNLLWTISSQVSDGIWYWRARVKDSYDLWSDYSSYWIIKIDTTPPQITNVIENPDPQEVYDFVNVSCIVTDNFLVEGVWIDIPGMGNFSMLYDSSSVRYYWNQFYDIIGTNTFTIWTNDTMNNWAYSSSSFTIHDTTPPEITDITAIPNPQEVFGAVNISSNITDNYQLFGSWIEILYPNGSLVDNLSMNYDSVNQKFYSNQNYDILGTYSFTIWANDTSNNWAFESNSFIIQDTTPPLIINDIAFPNPQEIYYSVNISANITDNYQLYGAWVEIFDPDGNNVGNFSMSYNPINKRYFWIQNYESLGFYSYTIFTNDSNDNWASVSNSFLIQDTTPPTISTVIAVPDPQEFHNAVNVTAYIVDNHQLFGAWIEIYDPNGVLLGNYTMEYNDQNNRFYWFQTYDLFGIYLFTIWANDTSNNWNFVTSSFVIQDTIPPTIIEVMDVPDPQEVFYSVNISANVTDNYQIVGVWVEITDPNGGFLGNFSMEYDLLNDRYYLNQTYNLIGSYTYTVSTNDTNDNWVSSSSSFLVRDTIPPNIIEVIVAPDIQYLQKVVNISADITDNYQLLGAWIQISDEGENVLGNYSLHYDPINSRYYWNQTYNFLGIYTFTIKANDTSFNSHAVNGTFTIQTTNPPIITNITAVPTPQIVKDEVIISARVFDEDTELYNLTVRINISNPNGFSIGNFTMIYNYSTDRFSYSSNLDLKGTYTFTIWANDLDDNWAHEDGSFIMEPNPEPKEYNWKPIIAFIFTVILLLSGYLISYKYQQTFKEELEKDKRYTFLRMALPFAVAEAITGIISYFTGLLSVPPIIGVGMIVDLAILIIGILTPLLIYLKEKPDKTYEKDKQSTPQMKPERILPPPPKKPGDEILPPPP